MSKRLYRNKNNAIIAGVCSGMGEYFDIDPVIIRIIWLIMFFSFGVGLPAYIIAWVIMPKKESLVNNEEEKGVSETSGAIEKSNTVKLVAGLILIIMGVLLIFNQHWYIIEMDEFFPLLKEFLVPVILIILGAKIVFKFNRNNS